MIHIDLKPEPEVFDDRVRTPGNNYLLTTPRPTTKQFESHSYWRRILPELHTSYSGICAYSCHWIPLDTGADTVEHVLPKSSHPQDAYEWGNYRLVCSTLNGRKSIYDDVLDPFVVENGWFVINFPSLLVKPDSKLEQNLKDRIWATIKRLGLNDEGTCLKSREKYIKDYCRKCVNFTFLQENAPFIAYELQRQGLVNTINNIMGYIPSPCALDV